MKRLVKDWLYRFAPRLATEFFSARARSHSHRLVQQWRGDILNRELISRFGRRVLSGPFSGMELSPETEKELLGPYLLGTFEAELHPWIERMAAGAFSTFVDVGSKFGYYSVGMALRCPKSLSIAFDTDVWARRAVAEMAAANGVRNIEIKGYCDRAWIENRIPPDSFVLSDCEGFEAVLFASSVPSLRTSTLLIETHDHEVAHTSEKIREAFRVTHAIEEVSFGIVRTSPVDLGFLSEAERSLAMVEPRLQQTWLLLSPKN